MIFIQPKIVENAKGPAKGSEKDARLHEWEGEWASEQVKGIIKHNRKAFIDIPIFSLQISKIK